MSDVFISYARSTEAAARQISEALRELGCEVWRDDELPVHQAYADVIEDRLAAARAVLVLWSADAVKSQWVRAEAEIAWKSSKLVQITLDGVLPPLPFNQIQCADLRHWQGEPTSQGWRKVVASITELKAGRAQAGRTAAAVSRPKRLVAVLAFDNLSADREIDYFSDGMSEEILHSISNIPELKVIGRSSSFQFRGKDKAAANVAAKLGATHVLDGAVRRSGERVRISAILTECEEQTTVWSGRFDRDLSDVFALQDEIATAVAEALQLVLAPTKASRKIDPLAYDLYLRARAVTGAPIHADQSIRWLEEAVSRSPDFAAAWASLATARADRARTITSPDAFAVERDRAIEACDRATALDPGLGLPMVGRSLLEPTMQFARREALLDKAMTAAASDPEILKHMADFTSSVGRTDQAFRLITQAQEIDPLNPIIANNAAVALADLGKVRDSYRAFEVARLKWPDFIWLVGAPLIVAAHLGDWDVADSLIALVNTNPVWRDGPRARELRPILATAEILRAPTPPALERLLAVAERQLETAGSVELELVLLLYAVGLKDEAFATFARSSFGHSATGQPSRRYLGGLIFGITNAGIRTDPRFVDLCGSVGLCDYWIATDRWPDCIEEVSHIYDLKAGAREFVSQRSERISPLGEDS